MARERELDTPGRTPEAVRAEIERTRADLLHTVGALRDDLAERTDWRGWVRRHPLECVAAAFMLGFVLGARR